MGPFSIDDLLTAGDNRLERSNDLTENGMQQATAIMACHTPIAMGRKPLS